MPLTPELTMTDCVDAAMEAEKTIGAHALPNSSRTDARSEQLRSSDDTVLPASNDRQTPIRRGLVAFWVHLTP
jgi:hypothetical protein